jgi:hypothetical protein
MPTVTVSVKKEYQDKLNFIKKKIPELKKLEGDTLTREFFYYSVREASKVLGYNKDPDNESSHSEKSSSGSIPPSGDEE